MRGVPAAGTFEDICRVELTLNTIFECLPMFNVDIRVTFISGRGMRALRLSSFRLVSV
jgi:hypothetical protein